MRGNRVVVVVELEPVLGEASLKASFHQHFSPLMLLVGREVECREMECRSYRLDFKIIT